MCKQFCARLSVILLLSAVIVRASRMTKLEVFTRARGIDGNDQWKQGNVALTKESERARSSVQQQPSQVGIVDGLYTIGAVGAGKCLNLLQKNGCMPGLRMWNEDAAVVDFAPRFAPFEHCRQSTMAVRSDGSTKYTDCAKEGTATVKQPRKNGVGALKRGLSLDPAASALHSADKYVERVMKVQSSGLGSLGSGSSSKMRSIFGVQKQAENKDSKVPQLVLEKAKVGAVLAKVVYKPCDEAKTLMAKDLVLSWMMVHFDHTFDRVKQDSDNILIAQDNHMNCFLTFEGSNSPAEIYGTNSKGVVQFAGKKYCGMTKMNAAYVNKLRDLLAVFGSGIKSTLAKCKDVMVAGHSLGGGVAEVFSQCANSQKTKDEDFQKQSWTKGQPIMMQEHKCSAAHNADESTFQGAIKQSLQPLAYQLPGQASQMTQYGDTQIGPQP